MQLAGWLFRPAWWAVAVFLPIFGLLCVLGFWQMDRAQQKSAMIAERSQAGKMSPLSLDQVLGEESEGWRAVEAEGRYLGKRQILLDNQVEQSRPGFQVWTPLELADGRLLMVNRGWVPGSGDRKSVPNPAAPEGVHKVEGLLRDWPLPGIRLQADNCDMRDWPRVLNYPRFADVQCQYGESVIDGLLLLSPDDSAGFVRNWLYVEMPPERHYGYAVTWFGLAITLAILFLVVNTRRS